MRQPTHLCTACLSEVRPKTFTPGNFGLELLLWLLMILPGLIYSISRLSRRFKGCPVCEALNPIPLNSPKASILLAERMQALRSAAPSLPPPAT